MIIRVENLADVDLIFALTSRAFEPMPYSDGSEPRIINQLRTDGDLSLSLVAVDGEVIVGHVAISKGIKFDGQASNWY